jgi:hypothetical protein
MIGDIFHLRRWWTADIRRGADGLWLHVRRGCRHVTIWRRTLLPFHESIEPTERIEVDVGDTFVGCGPSIAETVLVTVDAVDGDRLRVTIGGELEAGTRTVQLLAMDGLKQAKKRRAA